MTVKIKSEEPANGPDGLEWKSAGSVVEVEDDDLAAEILAKPGFSEVGVDEQRPKPRQDPADPNQWVTQTVPAPHPIAVNPLSPEPQVAAAPVPTVTPVPSEDVNPEKLVTDQPKSAGTAPPVKK